MSDQYDPEFREEVPGINQPWDSDLPPAPPPAPNRPGGSRPPGEVRMWTMAAHASALPAAFFAMAFLGPLVVWLVRKDIDEVSGLHAKEALNFNLSVTLYGVISMVLVLVLIGLPMLLGLGIFWIVNVLRATLAVNEGRTFRYPMTIRFL